MSPTSVRPGPQRDAFIAARGSEPTYIAYQRAKEQADRLVKLRPQQRPHAVPSPFAGANLGQVVNWVPAQNGGPRRANLDLVANWVPAQNGGPRRESWWFEAPRYDGVNSRIVSLRVQSQELFKTARFAEAFASQVPILLLSWYLIDFAFGLPLTLVNACCGAAALLVCKAVTSIADGRAARQQAEASCLENQRRQLASAKAHWRQRKQVMLDALT